MEKKNLKARRRETSGTIHGHIPMNLQLFAEPGGGDPAGGEGQAGGEGGGNQGGGEATIESLMADIAALKADNAKLKSESAKLKSERDKLCQSEGQLRKQLKAKLTEEEEAEEAKAAEKAAHDEYVAGLEKELAIIKNTARFIEMGFDPETAADTATADYEGDKDTVNANFKKAMAAQKKQMEAEIREKLLKDIPAPQSGNQSHVDYSKQITDAISVGDMHSAALAILNQAQAQSQT